MVQDSAPDNNSVAAPADEFVDDREVADAEDDKFSHTDLVAELRELIVTTPTPTNIALYGPWGSGKSGIKNLLGAELPGDECVFVPFDAFKYAADPLKRQFLTRIAAAVYDKKKANEFRDDLYLSKTTNTLSLEQIRRNPILKVLGVGVLLILAIIGLAGLVATIFNADAGQLMSDVARTVVPSGLLLAFLVGLIGKALPVTTERGQPSSDEQYEDRFHDLVAAVATEKKRLVVFIDELDRCAPDQVVEVLATMRAFLDEPGCVFVVAADQQVLERALTKKAPNTTPLDPDNPYYSTGTEYLDKVFQHQIAIPPVRHRSLTAFAVELVEGRPGVWSELPDVRRTVSILIPSHIRSPRRVKALLNSFVHLHRLAKRRVEHQMLGADLAERANELAVLTCLRLEFPLFARELAVHESLTELVRLADAGQPKPDWCLPSEWGLARAFAECHEPTTSMMEVAAPESDSPAQDSEPADTGEESADAGEAPAEASKLERVQAQHLIAYLKRTARVPGPGADLIHLEHGGYGWNLDPTVATQLERLALNGDRGGAVDLINGLSSIEASRGSLMMLAALLRDAVGIEQTNIVAVLLATASACVDEGLDSGPGSVDVVIDELAPYVAELDPTDLLGAFRLAVRSNSGQARELVARVIDRAEMNSDTALASAVIHVLPRVEGRHDDRISQAISYHLAAGQEPIVDALCALEQPQLDRVVKRVTDPIHERLGEDPEAATRLAGVSIRAVDQGGAALAEKLAAALVEQTPELEELTAVLDAIHSTEDRELAEALLDAAASDGDRAPTLLSHLASGLLATALQDEGERCAGTLLAEAVSGVVEAQIDEESALAWLDQLDRAGLEVRADSTTTDQATQNLPAPIAASPDAERRERGLSLLLRAIASSVLPSERIGDQMVAALINTQNPNSEAALNSHLEQWAPRVGAVASAQGRQQLVDFLAASFLPEPARTATWVVVAGIEAVEAPSSPATLEQMTAWRDSHPTELHTLATWVRIYQPNPDDAYGLLAPCLDATAVDDVSAVELRRYTKSLSAEQRTNFVHGEIARCATAQPRRDFIAAVRDAGIDAERVGPAIIDAYESVADVDNSDSCASRLIEVAASLNLDLDSRRPILEKLIIPALKNVGEGSQQAFDGVLRDPALVTGFGNRPDQELRRRFRDALRSAANRLSRNEEAEQLLDNAGYKRRTVPGIGPKRDV